MMKRSSSGLLLVVIVLVSVFISIVASSSSSSSGSGSSSDWESLFLSVPDASRCAEHLAVYTSVPHVAGTPGDWETVEYTVQQFTELGFNPQVVPFQALVTYPLERKLQLISPVAFTASLQEDVIPQDPTSGDSRVVPTFNAYSASGNVTGPLVYVNYGQYSDYQTLVSLGVNLTGAIHIARYGAIFRGTKAMIAQSFGALALLIYSDPADDGYVQGPVYPDGPWRPESGVQRGSAAFISVCPGDPSSPLCQYPNSNSSDQLSTMPSIPVQPISWGDAYPLLFNLEGQTVPTGFQGGLNFTYHLGPGGSIVNLEILTNFTETTLWNVIVEIPGATDDIVLLGNHRDAWTFGGVDPNSGSATLLELARGYSTLLQAGWQPTRTIVLASWDGEEYGLLGSTNWANQNAALYGKSLVAYLNVDTAVAGVPSFSAAGSPSLAQALREVTQVIIDPYSGLPLSQVWNFSLPLLGSGSDFTAYLDHLGIPSVDLTFYGPYGVYHSVYDSFHWMSTEGDTTFVYHRAMAQLWGLLALRLADTPVVPLNITGDYPSSLSSSLQFVEALLQQYNGTSSVDFTSLTGSIKNFTLASEGFSYSSSNLTQINNVLSQLERYFLGPGLPGRPYYKHVLQAPGLYLGYAADPFPGVSQAIRDQDWTQTNEQLQILISCINQAANSLSS